MLQFGEHFVNKNESPHNSFHYSMSLLLYCYVSLLYGKYYINS